MLILILSVLLFAGNSVFGAVIENFDSYATYSPDFNPNAGYSEAANDWNPVDSDTIINRQAITNWNAYSGKCVYYNYDIGDANESIILFCWNIANWSNANWLSLYIKVKTNYTGSFYIYYKENTDNDEWLYTIPAISIKTNYKQFAIPFITASWSSVDWDGDGGPGTFNHNSINNWRFVIESSTGGVNDNEIWIDEFTTLTNPLPYNDWSFNDYINYDAFLSVGHSDTPSDWNPADGDTKYNLAEISTNGAYSGKCLHYNYDIGDAWESIGFKDNNSTNWSGGSSISVRMKGYAGDPETIDFYFSEPDGDEWVHQKNNALNANWQEFTVPLLAGSWTWVNWSAPAGPQTFSVDNIDSWGIFLESSTGGRLNRDVWIDEFKVVFSNIQPQVIDYKPKYFTLNTSATIQLKIKDKDGITNINLKINDSVVSPTIITGTTNIITYYATTLSNNRKNNVQLYLEDKKGLPARFGYSFFIPESQKIYDVYNYDKVHFESLWAVVSYNASGSTTTATNNTYEGYSCGELNYALGGGYGEFGIQKTFEALQDWTSYSNLIIYTKGTNPAINPNFDILIYEDSGDVWTEQIYNCFNQTTWEQQIIDISGGLAGFSFATWCTDQPGYTGNKVRDANRIQKITFNISGAGLSSKAYIDYFNLSGYNPIDSSPPTFSATAPANGSTNVNEDSNIYTEINDNKGVVSNSINAIISFSNYITNYTAVAILNGAFQQPYLGSIVFDGDKGYDVTITNSLKSGFNYKIKIIASDSSSNTATNSFNFTTAGPYFGKFDPYSNEIDVAQNRNIIFLCDNLVGTTLNVDITTNGTTHNVITNGVSSDPAFPATVSGLGPKSFNVDINPVSDFNFNQTVYVKIWGADYPSGGTYTTNSYSFQITSGIPKIIEIAPTGSNVPRNTDITFRVYDNSMFNPNNIIVSIDGVMALGGNYAGPPPANSGLNGYYATIRGWTNSSFYITITNDFNYSQTISVVVSATDSDFNSVTTNWSFITEAPPDSIKPITSINPASGTFIGSIKVTLTANEPSKIYYTLNGVTPTTNSSFLVNSGDITITSNTILKYFARDTAGNMEAVKTGEFIIIKQFSEPFRVIPNIIDLSKCERSRIFINEEDEAQITVYNVLGDIVKEYPKKIYKRSDFEYFPEDCNSNIGAGLYIVVVKGTKINGKQKMIIYK